MPEIEEAAKTAAGLDRDHVRDVFRAMLKARLLESKLSSLYKAGMEAADVRQRARVTLFAYDTVYGA